MPPVSFEQKECYAVACKNWKIIDCSDNHHSTHGQPQSLLGGFTFLRKRITSEGLLSTCNARPHYRGEKGLGVQRFVNQLSTVWSRLRLTARYLAIASESRRSIPDIPSGPTRSRPFFFRTAVDIARSACVRPQGLDDHIPLRHQDAYPSRYRKPAQRRVSLSLAEPPRRA